MNSNSNKYNNLTEKVQHLVNHFDIKDLVFIEKMLMRRQLEDQEKIKKIDPLDPYKHQKKYYITHNEQEKKRNRAYTLQHYRKNPEPYRKYYSEHKEKCCMIQKRYYQRKKLRLQQQKDEEMKKAQSQQNDQNIETLLKKKDIENFEI